MADTQPRKALLFLIVLTTTTCGLAVVLNITISTIIALGLTMAGCMIALFSILIYDDVKLENIVFYIGTAIFLVGTIALMVLMYSYIFKTFL